MAFEINGVRGKYDGKVSDESVKYGRNAVENHLQYMEAPLVNDTFNPAPILDFSPNTEAGEANLKSLQRFVDKNDEYLNSLPPLEFEYRYMPKLPEGQIDKKALLGAAYEEMGTKELPVKEFENRYLIDDSMTAEPIDINKDGKIDIAEYATTTLAADLASKGTTDPNKINGSINSQGLNAVLAYTQKSNAAAATKLYSSLYNKFDLGSGLDSFKAI